LTPKVVEKLDYERQDDVFELVSLIAFGKVQQAFQSLRSLLDQGGYHRLLLDQLGTLYANLWLVLKMPPAERTDWQISGSLGVGSHRARQLAFLYKRYDIVKVRDSYLKVMGAYENCYQRGCDEGLTMVYLLKELCESKLN